VASFHPNLTSCSPENVYIQKVSLKFWRIHLKNRRNQEKVRNRFLSSRGTCSPHFQNILLSSTLAIKLLTNSLMAKKKSKRNITGLRNQPKLAPHIESMDAVSNSGSPQVPNEQTDLTDEEEWCPNLQFDSYKPDWNASDTEDDIDSEDEQDFLDRKPKQKPGVNVRKYRNSGLYVALMRAAIRAGDDPRDKDWVLGRTQKKL